MKLRIFNVFTTISTLVLAYTSNLMATTPIPVSPQSSLAFFNTVGKLKILKRTGWIHNGSLDISTIDLTIFSYIILKFCIMC